MENTNQPLAAPPTNPSQPPSEPVTPVETVRPQIDPSLVTEPVTMQPAETFEAPVATEDRPELVSDLPALQPDHFEPASPAPTPAAAMSYETEPIAPTTTMPDASQMELSSEDEPIVLPPEEPLTAKKIGKTAGAIALALIVGLIVKSNSATLGGQKIKNKGYTYSFKFYRNSSKLTYGDGAIALKHNADNTVGSLKPTPSPDLTSCTKLGNGWKEVFKVNMNNATVPVCTPDNKTYIAVFSAAGHGQLFSVAYNNVQKTAVYPVLKTMFTSVTVKK